MATAKLKELYEEGFSFVNRATEAQQKSQSSASLQFFVEAIEIFLSILKRS